MFTKDKIKKNFVLKKDEIIKISSNIENDKLLAIAMFVLSSMIIAINDVEGNPKVTLDKTYKIDVNIEGIDESQFSGLYLLSEIELLAKELFKHYQFKFHYKNLTIELINP